MGFKSGTLLNLAYNIKQCNLNFKPKDKLKIPTVLLVTHENTVVETIDRLYSLSVSENTEDRLRFKTPKEAISELKNKGKLKLTKENNIDIYIKYIPPGTADVNDVNDLIDDLEETGREIICVIHDYIKKINSNNYNSEARLELGQVVDDFKAIANERNIPIILASQLNRTSSKTIDGAISCNKSDLARFLNASDVGESWNIIENSDWVCIINRERQLSENKLYLTVKRLKIRYSSSDSIDYFNHPFKDNEFGLMIDTDLDRPLSKKYLSAGAVSVYDDEENGIVKVGKKGRLNAQERMSISTSTSKEDDYLSLNELTSKFIA